MRRNPPLKKARSPGHSPPTKKALKSYFITDRKRLHEGDLLMAVERAVAYGVDVIQIREKDLPARPLVEIAWNAVRVARGTGTKIVVNDRLDVALASGAAGVHLPADGFSVGAIRRVAPVPFLVGVSTHSLGEARRAAAEGADFIVFGPVFRTTSKPGARGLGVHALAEVVREANLPVYALGGMTPERVGSVARAGAAGVAGISVFLEEDSLRKLMEAIDQTDSD